MFVQLMNKEIVLVRSKIIVRSGPKEDKDVIYGYSLLASDDVCVLVSFSRNGAIYKVIKRNSDSGGVELIPDKSMGYICGHCLAIVQDNHKLDWHVSSQHLGPVKCKMCKSDYEDTQQLNSHKKTCSFECGVEGCELKHKKLIDAQRHYKKYLKTSTLS